MLKYLNNYEHPDIWLNLGGNSLNSFRDSNKKRIYRTRNKERLMICPILLCNISTILCIKISTWYLYELFPLHFQEKIWNDRIGQEIVLFSLFTFTRYLVVGLKLGTQDIQVPFFTDSLLPLNNLRHPWKKKKSRQERKFRNKFL